MIDPKFLSELERFSLIVRKRVTSKYSGERKSPYSGMGTIFKDHRQYSVGDNFKAIDWKVYGRTDDLYIKVFEEERNLDVHILLDTSNSMDYRDKFDFAGKISLGMAFLALKNNERVNFATFGEDANFIKGQRGKNQITNMFSLFNELKPSGKTNFFLSIKDYMKKIKTRSFIVIVSDFLMPIEQIVSALQLIPRGHQVKLIQVLDFEEKEMPFEGDFNLIDSESKTVLRTHVSERLKKNYLTSLEKHNNSIKSICNKEGILFHSISTEKTVFDSFFDIID